MSTYKAGYVPEDPNALAEFLRREFQRLEQALNEPQNAARLRTLHVEPKKMEGGMLCIADGTDWNPNGQGAGLYRRNEANDAWVRVERMNETWETV